MYHLIGGHRLSIIFLTPEIILTNSVTVAFWKLCAHSAYAFGVSAHRTLLKPRLFSKCLLTCNHAADDSL